MARGKIFSARVEGIAAGGAGIARLDGKSVFIDFTAAGDMASFRIEKDHKKWAEAELLEVLEPSPDRVRAACPHYGVCGGCSLQHINYAAQIKAKAAILGDAFKRIGGINPPEIKVYESEPFGYRNRVQLHRAENGGLGFRERKSPRIAAIEDCPVAEKGIREALKKGSLAAVGKARFAVYSRGDTFLHEGGKERGKVRILDREIAMDAGLFFQSNAAMLERLISDLGAAAGRADNRLPLADLYCGVGIFASFLGGRPGPGFPEIALFEESRAALSLARENMPEGKKLEFHARKDSEWIAAIKNREYGFMVLDPPRLGLCRQLRDCLAECGPALAAYVSCDPATLARDSRALLDGGYALEELAMYDFYPQTAHI